MKRSILFSFLLLLSFLVSAKAQTRPDWVELKNKPSAMVTPVTYGAATTASAEVNDVAFARAIAVLKAQGGGEFHIPAGVFQLSQTLTFDFNGVRIVGDGSEVSVLQSSADPIVLATGTFSTDAANHKFAMAHIQLRGDGTNTGASVYYRFINDWESVKFKRLQHGVRLTTCYYTTFSSCTWRDIPDAITGAGNSVIVRGSWFVESSCDISNFNTSLLDGCNLESGGAEGGMGLVIGDWTTVRNTRIERVNQYEAKPYVTFKGSNSRFYECPIHWTYGNEGTLSATAPIILIEGNNNFISPIYLGGDYRVAMIASSATGNIIELPNEATPKGVYTSILGMSPGTAKNDLLYREGFTKSNRLHGTKQSPMGTFLELGSNNTQFLTNWETSSINIAALATASFPTGYDDTYAGQFFSLTPVATSPTTPNIVVNPLVTPVATDTAATFLVLVKNPSAKRAQVCLQGALGVTVEPYTDWHWIVVRGLYNGTGIRYYPSFYLMENISDPASYWVAADGPLYVGLISLVRGSVPAYVGKTTYHVATYSLPMDRP